MEPKPKTLSDVNLNHLKIWRLVQKIPSGNVASYGQVADLAGLPGRARLVGKCLGLVPSEGIDGLPVPWYRVVRSSGQIAFSQGSKEFELQRSLLLAEGVFSKRNRVSMKEYEWQPSLSEILFSLSD